MWGSAGALAYLIIRLMNQITNMLATKARKLRVSIEIAPFTSMAGRADRAAFV